MKKYFRNLFSLDKVHVNILGAIGLTALTSFMGGAGSMSNEVCLDHLLIPNLFSGDLYFIGYLFLIYGYILTNYLARNEKLYIKDLIVFLPYILLLAFFIIQASLDGYSQWYVDCYSELQQVQK